jgi:hypothetical protein
MTPEISNLIYWSHEGEHYEMVDGQAQSIEDKDKID